MKPKVAICKKIPEDVMNFISKSCDIRYYAGDSTDSGNVKFSESIREVEGIMQGSGTKIDKEFLDQASQLKIACNISVGYNNLDIEELTSRGIMATNTPDVLTDTTADLIFSLIMATARRISELDRYVKNREWDKMIGEELFGVDIHHKALGIIGMGRIGTAIAKRARLGFDMEILYHNRRVNEKAEQLYDARKCALDELLSKSDFVCLMTPLTVETKHLMDEREFHLMKKSAIFINGSRGGTVNEKALIKALKNRTILGAGLDVYDQEPVHPDNPLLKMDQVITLPHIGSATYETRKKMAWTAAENLVKGLTDGHPPALINKSLLSE